LRVRFDADIDFVANLLDKVLGHALPESGSSDQHDHLGRIAGIENGSLSGGVAASDDENTLARNGDAVKA
jgi:hypothetical protein